MTDINQTVEAVRPLAARALSWAMDGDMSLAARAIQRISDEHDGLGVLIAMTAWIDTAIMKIGMDTSRPVRLSWLDLGSGRIDTDAEQVPPTVRWAGRVFAARAVLDKPAFDALIQALPDDDPLQVGEHVGELLRMIAYNINNADRIRCAAEVVQQAEQFMDELRTGAAELLAEDQAAEDGGR